MQYLISAGLLQVSFFEHFIVRSVVLLTSFSYIIYRRVQIDELKPTTYLLVVAIWVITESMCYVTYRSQAKLFIALRSGVIHQRQLFNLLDTVPDMAFLCHRRPESTCIEPILTNRKMDEFFGGGISSPIDAKDMAGLPSKDAKSVKYKRRREHQFSRKIFQL